ncbi:MAG: 8-amino-7-oxononanoate synthase [Acidimicrobiia bacterium]|nr:8-amino-7-oxononanoate synthase [Acidimicrobiia bacterium]
MTSTRWQQWVADQCARIVGAGQWRRPRDLDAAGPAGSLIHDTGERPVVSFASNDYLGLTQHPSVIAAAHDALDRWGAGSGAARLIVGSRPIHSELETELAAWKGTERALLFPTGFAANLGVLSTLAAPDVRVCSDELNHASIIDGCRLGRGDVRVYPHRDVDAVDKLLEHSERAIVVTDTVFSMDGDTAPVYDLLEVCTKHGALLVLDEAHAVLGPHVTLPEGSDVLRVGTLSKTLGALGGFVAGPAPFIDLLVNRARPFIFTTASTPADSAAALAALRVLCSAEGDDLVARLRGHVGRVSPGHPSPIIPVVLGNERRALAASAALLERGLLVPAIRPPTVAPGTSRLRIALSAAHTDAQITLLTDALRDVVGKAA